jgi:hypothetical protein
MNRQEILLNIALLTVIGALTLFIFEGYDTDVDVQAPTVVKSDLPPAPETSYDPDLAMRKYPTFGEKAVFQAIITPTPTPPPPTPTPTKTPDINTVFAQWRLMTVDANEVTFEDKSKTQTDPENSVFMLRVGQSRPVEVEKGVFKNAILKRMDANSDNPSATLRIEDLPDEKTLKMFEEAAPMPGNVQ